MPRRRLRLAGREAALLAAAAVGITSACARQGMPPGGPEDRRPPVVVATVPDTFAVLTEPFRGPVRFIFDERISERTAGGSIQDAVVVSPRTGDVRVSHGRQSISVDMDGGFQPGLVYRVTLLPVLRDLFNNQMLAPFEVVFSTGGDFNPSAVAGTVWDRNTAESVEALEVLALPREDPEGPVHVARTDTGGVYVFRYLPPGGYRLVAYQDRNRNRIVDPMELQGEGSFAVSGADTLFVDVAVLQPDTTPARLLRAQVLDSLTVLLEFDDHLDPEARSDLFGVTLVADSTEAPVRVDVFHERAYAAWVGQLQDSFARIDSIQAAERAEDALFQAAEARRAPRADSAAGDTLPPVAVPQVTPRPAPAPGPAARSQHPLPPLPPPATGAGAPRGAARGVGGRIEEVLAPDGRPLPSRRLVLRLQEFLEVNAPHRVRVVNVVNINGVAGGGGEAAVIREAPPDTASADTLAGDTLARDTVPPDTVPPPPPDTLARDTIPPDTVPRGAALPPGREEEGWRAERPWPFLPERRR